MPYLGYASQEMENNMNKIIAIIPARKGSKRLPNKNILSLAGKPMIAWTIEAARKSKIFSEILVSTDSEEIAMISREFGASVPFLRKPRFADDYIPASLATWDALLKIEKYKAEKFDVAVQLMPNCPCRTALDIVNSYKHFLASEANFQVSVFRFGWMNPWWAMKIDKNLRPKPIFPKALSRRSQDLAELFCPTGAIWIAKVSPFKKEKTFYGKGYKVYPLNWKSAIDIDTKDDFSMVEEIFPLQRRK